MTTALTKGGNNIGHIVSALDGSAPLPDAGGLLKHGRDDLVALATVYLMTQVAGSSPHTLDAKRRDLNHFFNYYSSLFGHLRPAEWYTSVTRGYLKELQSQKGTSEWTVVRRYASVRAFARWASKLEPSPFTLGCPTDGVKPPQGPDADWRGLERRDELRLIAAAERLRERKQRGPHQGTRNFALVQGLLGTGLRISELLSVDIEDWNGKGFSDVLQKGGTRRKFVKCWGKEARAAIDAWLEERGEAEGPLFTTGSGKRLSRQNGYDILKRIEAEAIAHLAPEEHFTLSPHTLRHTLLRKLIDERGIHVAMAQSGHRSDKYIWTYTKMNQAEMEASDD